jgi:translation initiation factor IF-3
LNHQIRVPEVRLIDDQGVSVGIVPIEKALLQAKEKQLDLVEVSPNASPPVCKIQDYNKVCYNAEKKVKKSVRDRGVKKIKKREIKFRPVIEKNDYDVKCKKIISFINQGDRVKISIRFRGREITNQQFGLDLMKRIENDLAEFAIVDQHPKLDGRQMIMVVAPAKNKVEATNEDK